MASADPAAAGDRQDDELDLGDLLDSTQTQKNALVVHNITVVADTGVNVDLAESLSKFGNLVYEPKEFSCIRLDVRVRRELDSLSRLETSADFEHIAGLKVVEAPKPFAIPGLMKTFHEGALAACEAHRDFDAAANAYTSVKVSLFSNGKLSVTGARSILSATVAMEKVCRALRKRVSRKARLCRIMCSNMLVVYAYPHEVILPLLHKACKDSAYDPLRFSGVRVKVPMSTPQESYDVFGVLALTNFAPRYAERARRDRRSESEPEPEESESEEEFVAAPAPAAPAPRQVRLRASKLGIQRFVDSTISDKRKVHHSVAQPTAAKRKRATTRKVSIWANTNLLEANPEDLSDPAARPDAAARVLKEEVVTVNVFASGNITFTGARAISSVQRALSQVYPFLELARRRD